MVEGVEEANGGEVLELELDQPETQRAKRRNVGRRREGLLVVAIRGASVRNVRPE
jgi:hypothetical protein